MITIGVLSDTHLRCALHCADFLDFLDRKVFRKSEVIVHAGDLVDHELLHVFAPRIVHAVRGNMDPSSASLPDRKVFEIAGFRFGLMHGWGPAEGLAERVMAGFSEDSLDCLIYGHSHMPDCRLCGGLLLFNPGSATSPRGGCPPSVGMLKLDETGIQGRILSLESIRQGSSQTAEKGIS